LSLVLGEGEERERVSCLSAVAAGEITAVTAAKKNCGASIPDGGGEKEGIGELSFSSPGGKPSWRASVHSLMRGEGSKILRMLREKRKRLGEPLHKRGS